MAGSAFGFSGAGAIMVLTADGAAACGLGESAIAGAGWAAAMVCGGVIIAGIAVAGGCAFCEAVTAFCLANRASHGIAPVLKPGDALE